MSFTTLHSPKLSLTSSFGSSLNLAEHQHDEADLLSQIYNRQASKSPRQHPPTPNEHSPLIPSTDDMIAADNEDAYNCSYSRRNVSASHYSLQY